MQDGTIRLVQAVGAGSFTLPTSGETLPPAQRERLAQVFEKLPAFCRVDIEFKPAPQSDIRVEVWMPESAWNGRPLGVGNGGWGGVINYSGLAQGVMQGFAAASTDMGTAGFSAPDRTTWKILESDDRLVDFGSRATHLMTVAAKLLIQSFYGSSPHFSYWNGCSTGGKQGLAEAQRYPLDYNGIVEGDPASYFTHLMFSLQWYGAAARSVSASPMPASKFSALHQAVLKACDSSDGVADGIVSDPEHCNFDPRTIACKADDAPDCLTPAELKMVTAIYECAFNPRTGEQIFPGEEPGSELGWVGMLHVPGPTLTSLSYFQFALHRNPDWSPLSLNFDSDVADADRVDGATLNDIDADLHAFKAAGGKLIMFHGWSDPIIAPFESVHYYRSVVAAMGGSDQASSFVRLFMLPGVGHCQGGPGADNFDKIGLIEKWTESGLPPSAALVAHRDPPGSAFTRPLCPYPQSAFWRGTGDSNAAENFVCRDGTPANAHPAAFAASLMKK
jgi:feruloyl esterase